MASKPRVPITWRSSGSRLHLPRLLIEADESSVSASELVAFWKAGFNPTFCKVSEPEASCPLVHGEHCPLVDAADVVFHRLDPRTGIVEAINRDRPELGVVLNAQRGRRDDVSDDVEALQDAVSNGKAWKRAFGRLGISQG